MSFLCYETQNWLTFLSILILSPHPASKWDLKSGNFSPWECSVKYDLAHKNCLTQRLLFVWEIEVIDKCFL